MATIQRFEDLPLWIKARELNKILYQFTNKKEFQNDFSLRSQMRKSSISVLSNIAEGFDRNGTREFIQFLSIAKGSAAELRAQCYAAIDLNYFTVEEHEKILLMLLEIGKMLGGFISYLQKTEIKGNKFKESYTLYGLHFESENLEY